MTVSQLKSFHSFCSQSKRPPPESHRDRVGLKARFCWLGPSSPRRRCRCSAPPSGMRPALAVHVPTCSMQLAPVHAIMLHNFHLDQHSSIGAWRRTSTWQSRSCATSCGSPPCGSCTTRRRICSEATRCMCGATIFSPPTCCGVQRLCRLSWRRAPRARARAARSAWASRTSTRAAGLQQSRRGRRRLAELLPELHPRIRCRPGARVASPGRLLFACGDFLLKVRATARTRHIRARTHVLTAPCSIMGRRRRRLPTPPACTCTCYVHTCACACKCIAR